MIKKNILSSFLFTLLIIFSHCNRNLDPIAKVVDFGYDYHIIEPDSNIILKSDSLKVFVGYSGCSAPHQFTLQYYINEEETVIWFNKVTPDEPCDMYIFHWIKTKIPEKIISTRKLIFEGPRNVSLTLFQARQF